MKTSFLRPLVEFAAAHSQMSFMTSVSFEDSPEFSTIGAFCWKVDPDKLDPAALGRIQVIIGTNRTYEYPFSSTFRVSIGPVQLNSLEEEMILVLGHEFRHIDQFYSTVHKVRQYEVDAERHGIRVLEAYRAAMARGPAATPAEIRETLGIRPSTVRGVRKTLKKLGLMTGKAA